MQHNCTPDQSFLTVTSSHLPGVDKREGPPGVGGRRNSPILLCEYLLPSQSQSDFHGVNQGHQRKGFLFHSDKPGEQREPTELFWH